MDHRSPLKDLTSLNIPAIEETIMEKLNDCNAKKPRFSVIQAFDPLYDSPQRIFQNTSDCSNNSSPFQNINDNLNNENVNPFSNLINISDIAQDISIDEVKNFTEEIINEAINNIFARDNVCQFNIVDVPKTLNENTISLTQDSNKTLIKDIKEELIIEQEEICEFINTPELLQIKSKCDHATITHLETLLEHKSKELISVKEELSEIRKENDIIKLNAKRFQEELIIKEDKIGNYSKTIDDLEILLKGKGEALAKLESEVLKINSQCEESSLKVIEYKKTNERAEAEIIKLKEELHLILSKAAEDNIKKSLQDRKTTDELEKLVSEKSKEIKMMTEKIKEYEDILESHAKLLKKQIDEADSLREENQWAKKHLSNQEIAFGDVYDKYERCKKIIEGYKTNEEILKDTYKILQDTLKNFEDNNKKLQKEADTKFEKWCKELSNMKNEYQTESSKLLKKIKHLEIRNSSLTSTLEQKTLECQELTELCQEITRC